MKKILSIDGGGIRGIIPAAILSEIERRTAKPTAHLFDLIAGTSTGGILALALCKNGGNGNPQYSATQLIDLYSTRGNEIFSRSLWRGVSSVAGMLEETYPTDPLEKVLKDYLETDLLDSSLKPVLVSSYDIENRQPFFFKSWRDGAKTMEMAWVARATSAAPTYFEPFKLPGGTKNETLVDGGVFVNNPATSAYVEARRLYPDENDFLVVSLGTGQHTRPIHYEEAKDWGKAAWALPILSVVFDGVAGAVDYQMRELLRENFFRFQLELAIASDDMDDASEANILALKFEAKQLIEKMDADIVRLCSLLSP